MAIYIIRPSEENLNLIRNDLEKRVFDNFYLNFVEKCDEGLLQSFFSELIKADLQDRIYKVTVNPIGFFPYHPKVFSLNISSPYSLLNSPKTNESDIDSYFDKVGNGIFNTLFTLKTVPVIKYRTGWFAENIINVIQNNFKKTFDKFPELMDDFPPKDSLLVILDRDTDLPIMLHHAASLGSMTHDVFGITRKNKSLLSNKEAEGYFEIDPLNDFVWNSYLSTNFIDVREKILEEWKKVQQKLSFLDKKDNDDKINEALSHTLEGLRDTIEKQKVLENHTKFLVEKLSKELEDRQLGQFYEIEEAALGKRGFNKDLKKKFWDIVNLKGISLKDVSRSKEDIVRLCLTYYLLNPKIPSEELEEIEKVLNNLNQSTSSLDYLKQKRAFEESVKKGSEESSGGSESGFGFFQKSFTFFVSKVGSLMNTEQPSITADILTSLSNNKEVPNFVSSHAFKKGQGKLIPGSTKSFSHIIVFMVGGGSLSEYEYIDDILGKNKKQVIYGCDYLYRPTNFLRELEKLK